jgi:hypothetical protein
MYKEMAVGSMMCANTLERDCLIANHACKVALVLPCFRVEKYICVDNEQVFN